MPVIPFDELYGAAGLDLGYSEWMTIDQNRIGSFADVTDDHQWIHVDPVRAADGPFGGTIAHGYLTLSAVGARLGDLLVVEGASQIINYGLDRVRFPSAVPAGARVRARAVITEVTEVGGTLQVSARITGEAEGVAKPAVVADVIVRVVA